MGRLLLYGSDLRIDDKLRLNYCRKSLPREIRFAGRALHISDVESFVGAYEEIFIRGVYTFRSLSNCPRIIDAGANIGLATLFFKRLYPQCRVTAFEPDPIIFRLLQQNLAAFGLEDVQAINAAIWNTDATVPFVCQGGASGHVALCDDTSRTAPVTALRLKPWLSEKVDFLKLDIEGTEYEVLVDCRRELSVVDNLFVEYHSRANQPQKLAEILAIMKDCGLRYHIHEAFTSPYPFLDRELLGEMDLQLNISAFRSSV